MPEQAEKAYFFFMWMTRKHHFFINKTKQNRQAAYYIPHFKQQCAQNEQLIKNI